MTPATRRRDPAVVAIAGVRERLRAGVRAADVRCAHGGALIALAGAFPRSTFHGFGADPAIVAMARRAAAEARVSDRLTFEVAAPGAIPAEGFDLLIDAVRLVTALRPVCG